MLVASQSTFTTINLEVEQKAMRFFTRELVLLTQVPSDLTGQTLESIFASGSERWKNVNQEYLDYLRPNLQLLSAVGCEIARSSLHDARIEHLSVNPGGVELDLDTKHAPAIKETRVRLVFQEVVQQIGLNDLIGQTILHEEFYVCGDKCIEYSALCSRTEFQIRFRTLHVQKHGW